MNQIANESQKTPWIVAFLRPTPFIIIMLLTGGYLVAVSLGLVASANRFTIPEIMIGAGLLLAAAFLAQGSYVIRDLALGPTGVSAHFDRMEKRQNELETEMQALQMAVTGLVTKHELMHLKNLAAEGIAVVRFSKIMVQELDHLDAMMYIVPLDPRGLNAIEQDYGNGLDDFDLKQYVGITQEGLQYLFLRTRLAARAAANRATTS
jgi:hypothetical protein